MWLVFWCEGQEVHPSLVVSSTCSSCWFHNIGRASREADFSLYNTTIERRRLASLVTIQISLTKIALMKNKALLWRGYLFIRLVFWLESVYHVMSSYRGAFLIQSHLWKDLSKFCLWAWPCSSFQLGLGRGFKAFSRQLFLSELYI